MLVSCDEHLVNQNNDRNMLLYRRFSEEVVG